MTPPPHDASDRSVPDQPITTPPDPVARRKRRLRIARNVAIGVLGTLFAIWLILFITKGRFLKEPVESIASSLTERDVAVEGRVVALCPEVAGGLPTPRAAAEIPGGQGAQVLDGHARVITTEGEDVSAEFLSGAQQALALVQQHAIRIAVLKANSPSCGNLLTYDGTFSGVKVSGEGVTAALLTRHGVQVFSELQLAEAAAALASLI